MAGTADETEELFVRVDNGAVAENKRQRSRSDQGAPAIPHREYVKYIFQLRMT